MNSIVAQLQDLEDTLESVACDAFGSEQIPGMTDPDVTELLATTGRIQRRLEGVQIEATVQVGDRSAGLKEEDALDVDDGAGRPSDRFEEGGPGWCRPGPWQLGDRHRVPRDLRGDPVWESLVGAFGVVDAVELVDLFL